MAKRRGLLPVSHVLPNCTILTDNVCGIRVQVINVFMRLLQERSDKAQGKDKIPQSYFFNTFFYAKLRGPRGYDFKAVNRWTRRAKVLPSAWGLFLLTHTTHIAQIDIFALDYVFVPVHLGVHWCLAAINFKKRRTEYYDSLGGENQECHQVNGSKHNVAHIRLIPICNGRRCCVIWRMSGQTSIQDRVRMTQVTGNNSPPATFHISITGATAVCLPACMHASLAWARNCRSRSRICRISASG